MPRHACGTSLRLKMGRHEGHLRRMRHQKANDFAASPRATWLHDFSAERARASGQSDQVMEENQAAMPGLNLILHQLNTEAGERSKESRF